MDYAAAGITLLFVLGLIAFMSGSLELSRQLGPQDGKSGFNGAAKAGVPETLTDTSARDEALTVIEAIRFHRGQRVHYNSRNGGGIAKIARAFKKHGVVRVELGSGPNRFTKRADLLRVA